MVFKASQSKTLINWRLLYLYFYIEIINIVIPTLSLKIQKGKRSTI
jgi:hypothetical protein